MFYIQFSYLVACYDFGQTMFYLRAQPPYLKRVHWVGSPTHPF